MRQHVGVQMWQLPATDRTNELILEGRNDVFHRARVLEVGVLGEVDEDVIVWVGLGHHLPGTTVIEVPGVDLDHATATRARQLQGAVRGAGINDQGVEFCGLGPQRIEQTLKLPAPIVSRDDAGHTQRLHNNTPWQILDAHLS